jgi:hypothetical protein
VTARSGTEIYHHWYNPFCDRGAAKFDLFLSLFSVAGLLFSSEATFLLGLSSIDALKNVG